MLIRIITFAAVGFFVWSRVVMAAMTSTNFEIRWDTVSTGGSDTGSSASYLLRDTAEVSVAGTGTSSSYQLEQGYRGSIDDQLITFEVFAQDTASGRAATALSGTTVTTSTSGITVGTLIVVIQDLGAAQVSAIGEVASIGVGTLTVDAWTNGGTQPTVDGTNDYVYPVSSTSIALGTLSTSSISTAVVAFEVTAANDSGYTVQVFDDGNLRSGSNDIDDVTDGSITAGSEEHGARSSDATLSGSTFDTADTAILTTAADVATETAAKYESRHFLTLKTAISTSTIAESYSQSIYLIASGNY